MRHFNKVVASGFLLAAMLQGGYAPAQQKTGKDIPLIPRELFFDNPEVSGSQLSPDGKMISFLKANNGIMNIWVKGIDEPFAKARPLTASKEPMANYFWSYDGKYILFVEAKGGNENFNIYAVNPKDKAGPTGVPAARNLTPNDKVRAEIFNVSKKNPDIIWVGINDRDERWHDLYKLEISTGKLTKMEQNNDRVEAWIFDWDENVRLAWRSAEDGSTEILRRNADGSYAKIYSCGLLETVSPLAFTKDNTRLYLETNKGNDVNFTKLVLMDLNTGSTTDIEQDPMHRVDLGGAEFSDKTHEMILTSYTDAKTRLYFKDKAMEADYKYLKNKFPGQEISFKNSNSEETEYLVATYSDNKMPEVYLYDRKTKKVTFQYNPRPKLKAYEQYFGTMDPITYKSSDGMEIPAYLSLPKGVTAKNLPLIVFPHGGPWARDEWGFNPMAQWLTNRGYAVLEMNFRGSTGYGKQFLNAGNKQWGMLMQDDITWGVKDLVAKGMVDAKRVAIMGGSYGGYATLAGLAFTPDVYAAGVDIVGPSNLITLLNSIPAYWEAGRKQFTERMGDPSTPEGKALLEKQSPLNSAAKIKAPLMIIQGANDPRVKKAESDQIAMALRDLGRPVTYLCAPDEGHGYHKPINNLAAMGAAEVFLGKALNVRYQGEMKPDAQERLAQITVDVNKLVASKKIEVTPMKQLPTPTTDFAVGMYDYSLLIEMQGQKIPMELNRTVTDNGTTWVVKDKVASPMGDQVDEATYAKGTLALLSRKVSAGPQTENISFASNKITVNDKPVDVDGAYIIDGAGGDMIVARLPLKEGYETGLYVASQDGKTQLHQLKVVGTEQVGDRLCYKCQLTNVDDPTDVTTYFIGTTDNATYKAILPMDGVPGGKMTIELKK